MVANDKIPSRLASVPSKARWMSHSPIKIARSAGSGINELFIFSPRQFHACDKPLDCVRTALVLHPFLCSLRFQFIVLIMVRAQLLIITSAKLRDSYISRRIESAPREHLRSSIYTLRERLNINNQKN